MVEKIKLAAAIVKETFTHPLTTSLISARVRRPRLVDLANGLI